MELIFRSYFQNGSWKLKSPCVSTLTGMPVRNWTEELIIYFAIFLSFSKLGVISGEKTFNVTEKYLREGLNGAIRVGC